MTKEIKLKCSVCNSEALILRRSKWLTGKMVNQALCVECGQAKRYGKEYDELFSESPIIESQDAYRKRRREEGFEMQMDNNQISEWDEARERVLKRDNYRCLRCEGEESLQVDHIIPQYYGGSDRDENLQTLCSRCNKEKKDSLR